MLALDWVPGTGTVVWRNHKPLTEPLPDIAFHNALLAIWLGDKPADQTLGARLLGPHAPLRTALN